MVAPDRVRVGASRRALRCLPRDWKQGYTRTETRPVYRCGDYANRWHTSVVLLLNKSGGGQGRGERIWHADARIKFAGRKRREPQGYLVLPAALLSRTCSRVCRVCATRPCARSEPRADVAQVCGRVHKQSVAVSTRRRDVNYRMENIVKPVRWHRGEHFLGWKSPFVPLPARVMRKTATMRENRGCKKLARTAGNTRGHAEEEASAMGENGRRDSATRRYARRCE